MLNPTEKVNPFTVDPGSNIGMSILFFKTIYPQARITGFEPSKATCELLKRNIAANGLTRVEVHQAALGMEGSTIEFFVGPEEPGSLYNSNEVAK